MEPPVQIGLGDPSKHSLNSLSMTDTSSCDGTSSDIVSKGAAQQLGHSKVNNEELSVLGHVIGLTHASKLTALVGPAGSGKTAALDEIAGLRAGREGGQVRSSLCGEGRVRKAGQPDVGYVDSFDTLVGNLTVREMLEYTLELANPEMAAPARHESVQDLIRRLGLGAAQDKRIGNPWIPGITGGDIRRVSIGVALATNPTTLLVDEPAGNLDTLTGNAVVQLLRGLARGGLTVVAAMRSPSPGAWAAIDQLLVLLGGHLVYSGATGSAMVSHFELNSSLDTPAFGKGGSCDEATWLAEVLQHAQQSEEGQAVLVAAYDKASHHKGTAEAVKAVLVEDDPAVVPAVQQARGGALATVPRSLWTLMKYRTARNLRDPVWLLTRLVDKCLFTLLVTTMYVHVAKIKDPASIGNIISFLWMQALLPAFAASGYVSHLCMEMPQYMRERNAGYYRPIVYLLHKMIEEVGLMLPFTLIASCMLFFPTSLHGSWALFWVVYIITNAIGIQLAYLAAAACRTINAAAALVPMFALAMFYFAGVLLRLQDIHKYWKWLSYANFLRYAIGALLVNEYDRAGWDVILDNYDIGTVNKWRFVLYEALFLALFFLLTWLALARKRTVERWVVTIDNRKRA